MLPVWCWSKSSFEILLQKWILQSDLFVFVEMFQACSIFCCSVCVQTIFLVFRSHVLVKVFVSHLCENFWFGTKTCKIFIYGQTQTKTNLAGLTGLLVDLGLRYKTHQVVELVSRTQESSHFTPNF